MTKNPSKTIALSVVLTSGIVFLDSGLDGNWPDSRQIMGITIAFFLISAIGDADMGSTAAMVSLLLLVAITLQQGHELLNKLATKTSTKG